MKKVIVLLAEGFEECEALLVVDILRRAGVEVDTASISDELPVLSSRNIIIKADMTAKDADFESADMIFLPGGRLGVENLEKSEIVKEQVTAFAQKKMLAAVCAAPSVIAGLGLLEGKRATCHPDYECKMQGAVVTKESVSEDGNIITGQGLGATFELAFRLAELLAGPETAAQIKKAICYKY